MNYIIIAIIVVVVLSLLIYSIITNNKIKKNGIEAKGEISRIDVLNTQNVNEDGSVDVDTTKTYFVKYKNQDGEEIEARLNNPSFIQKQGDIIKIKYLPEKPYTVVRIKE